MAKKQHGRDLTPEEMCEMLDEWANGADDAAVSKLAAKLVFATHRTLQQRIMAVFIRCIEKWAGLRDGQYDPRNEATVKLCRKIITATGDNYDRYLPHI